MLRAEGYSTAQELETSLHGEGHPVENLEAVETEEDSNFAVMAAELLFSRAEIFKHGSSPGRPSYAWKNLKIFNMSTLKNFCN